MSVFPGSGMLACTTRCYCNLVDVARPAGAPQGAMPDRPWETASPKAGIRGHPERHRPRHKLRRVRRVKRVRRG